MRTLALWFALGLGITGCGSNGSSGTALVSIGPGSIGVDALVGNRNGARTLTIHDSQHDYVYTEQRGAGAKGRGE